LKEAGVAGGAAWMFFGCRKPEEDYLYRADLEGFAADGTLSELNTAFSREGAEKVYVQHKLASRAEVGGCTSSIQLTP
jgi:sulfite reductase alpha subunit-like flavoprotein